MKRAALYFQFAIFLLISAIICRAQASATNSPHPLPKMEDIDKWRASSMNAMQQGADQGNTDAMLALYFAYSARAGTNTDCADCREAKKWLTKSAEADNAYAQCLLGYRLERPRSQGSYNPPPNMPEAVRWYQRSAEQGWVGGEYRLGLCYLEGKGVEQDEEHAVELLRKAADQEQIWALSALAGCYAKGIGTPRNDEDRPLQLLKRVAANTVDEDNYFKIEEAYDHIIFRYEFGVGTQHDILLAAQWYCHAAIRGIQYYTLADKIEVDAPKGRQPDAFDEIVPDRDYINAYDLNRWGRNDPIYPALSVYLKAARGDANAMMRIGDLYLIGNDVPKNPAKAHAWFMLASQKGAKDADEKISKAASSMSNAELEKSRQLLPKLVQELEGVSSAIH